MHEEGGPNDENRPKRRTHFGFMKKCVIAWKAGGPTENSELHISISCGLTQIYPFNLTLYNVFKSKKQSTLWWSTILWFWMVVVGIYGEKKLRYILSIIHICFVDLHRYEGIVVCKKAATLLPIRYPLAINETFQMRYFTEFYLKALFLLWN